MGRICSVDAILDAKLDAAIIKTIINNGSELGFEYYICDRTKSPPNYIRLSIEEVVNEIIKGVENSKDDTWNLSGKVSFNFQNNAPIISFRSANDTTMRISIYTVSHPWCQDKLDTSKRCIADWDLYITILLEVCKDFAILEVSTDDEYFNWG